MCKNDLKLRFIELENRDTESLVRLGFQQVSDLLPMRIFDVLNLYTIDNRMAEEILLNLYHRLNPNDVVDNGIRDRTITQPFNYHGWRKAHKDFSQITVSDLVMAEDIHENALLHLFDAVSSAFYHSPEYNGREYRYRDRDEYEAYRKGQKI